MYTYDTTSSSPYPYGYMPQYFYTTLCFEISKDGTLTIKKMKERKPKRCIKVV